MSGSDNRSNNDDVEEEDRLTQEEAMERLMLEQERQQDEQEQQEEEAALWEEERDGQQQQGDDAGMEQEVQDAQEDGHPGGLVHGRRRRAISYTQTSFGAALAVVWYALRTRQQWYLALVYLTSSKWAYIVLGNAIVASCVSTFRLTVKMFLNGLRPTEAEGLGDFFRWNVTETCLALTMFRSQITVKTALLFLVLVLAKCLHWVVETRRGHFQMTQEAVVPGTNNNNAWPAVQSQFVGIFFFLEFLLVADVVAVAQCAHDIAQNGPTVSVFFGFESAILFVSAMSNLLLAIMHFCDGVIHWSHEHTTQGTRQHNAAHAALHAWKDHKATFTFAVEVQAQAAKFLFYIIFFGIVLTYYGMPINLFREVYMSFQNLRQRLLAFAKYRRLMQSMNRFESLTTQEQLEEAGKVCIICRDAMTLSDCKKLPGCGHVFHKSCLREWLIHQQTCPTCRGDIAATEARVRRAEQQQPPEQAAVQQEEAAEQQEHQENVEEQRPQAEARALPPTAPAPRAQATEPEVTTRAPPKIIQRSKICIPPPLQAVEEPAAPKDTNDTAGPAFPCLYKVSDTNGAIVWTEVDGTLTSIRVVPFETLVLCTSIEWIRSDDWSGMMLKMPDGFVRENQVERLSIPLPLKQPLSNQEQKKIPAVTTS